MDTRKYDVVTVTFEGEYDYMLLQARSMRLYCPAELVSRFLVIDNSSRLMSDAQKRTILTEYGHLAGQVRFVAAADIARMPKGGGWQSQQILKLMSSRLIEQERYLVLDAKNHLVRPLTREFLEDPDGRARLVAHSYREHVLRPQFERVFAFLKIDVSGRLDRFPYSVTPFVMYAAVSRDLVDQLSAEEGMSFPSLFEKHRLWEFLLYSASVVRSGRSIEDIYVLNQRSCPIIWIYTANKKGCLRAISRSGEFSLPFFAIHRRAIVKLDDECRAMIAAFWAERQLFASPDDAERFMRRVRWRNRLYWLQSAPGKAARLVKRTVKRVADRSGPPQ